MLPIAESTYTPKVSIIVATYNRAQFLKEAIESVLTQSFENFELIIVDDGSMDKTREMINNFADNRIKYIYQQNKGRSNARNKAISIAKGQYIAFLDSDDLYLPDKLSLQVDYLDNHPKVGMIYTSALCIEENGNLTSVTYEATASGEIYKEIAFFVPVTITLPTVMVRREVLSAVGLFDEKMHRFEDTDLWRRISKISHIDGIKEYTCKLRTHSNNHLIAQNPDELVSAIHYYAKKIRKEDACKYLTECDEGLAAFYTHYGFALLSIPQWQFYGKELLKVASFFRPENKVTEIKFQLKIINYNLKNAFSNIRSLIQKIAFKFTSD
jgi:glycosyltransferase involved in cell wall biosynthesis